MQVSLIIDHNHQAVQLRQNLSKVHCSCRQVHLTGETQEESHQLKISSFVVHVGHLPQQLNIKVYQLSKLMELFMIYLNNMRQSVKEFHQMGVTVDILLLLYSCLTAQVYLYRLLTHINLMIKDTTQQEEKLSALMLIESNQQ